MKVQFGTFLSIAILAAFVTQEATADRICLRVSRTGGISKKVVTGRRCPSGYTELLNTANLQGAAGADGRLSVYGDGSAGEVALTVNTDFRTTPPANNNFQYVNFTVGNGVTLTVASGTTIRCSGTFVNYGTIIVAGGAEGGQNSLANETDSFDARTFPGSGIALRPAGHGSHGDNNVLILGGPKSIGVGQAAAPLILNPGHLGGGGGAGTSGGKGGKGGGVFRVITQGAIVNAGTLNADGEEGENSTGSGGGGGGVVILASLSSVLNTGSISAEGGDGSSARPGVTQRLIGNGGGGGGGIIHFLSPSISSTGTTSVAGGLGGFNNISTGSSFSREAGSAGGASAGDGGAGQRIDASSGTLESADAGTIGVVVADQIDPTDLF